MQLEGFKELGLSDAILRELAKKGFEEPTEIQKKIIPVLLAGRGDIAGQAQTGTGKTGAFGIPIIDRMEGHEKLPRVLVITPTRELAVQISEELNSYRGKKKISVFPVYGGQSYADQIKKLENGADIIAGTPGRIIDHLDRKTLSLENLQTLVIDEADEMLRMGFIEEVDSIISRCPENRQTLLFSATMPQSIQTIAKKYMKDFQLISTKSLQLTADLTDQICFEVNEGDRFEALCRIIDMEDDFYGMIFCRTKTAVDELVGRLIDRGYNADGIHGDFSQAQRERTLDKFKKHRIDILVASDVASRGIDVENISHVINYTLPQNPDDYVHRIGRTGRAGRKGIAVTFVTRSEIRRLTAIQKAAKTVIRKEKLPAVSDIVGVKKKRLMENLESVIRDRSHAAYLPDALRLMEEHDPADVIAAVIKTAFDDELDSSRYREIKEDFSPDRKGTTRLFVSLGKKDGLTAKKLLKMINNETKVPAGRIRDVHILDCYSFLTAGFSDAEVILKNFKRNRDGLKPAMIQKANEMKVKKRGRSGDKSGKH